MTGLPLCRSLRQREVNQNSQIDQSQAGSDVNRHQADQGNAGCQAPILFTNMTNIAYTPIYIFVHIGYYKKCTSVLHDARITLRLPCRMHTKKKKEKHIEGQELFAQSYK